MWNSLLFLFFSSFKLTEEPAFSRQQKKKKKLVVLIYFSVHFLHLEFSLQFIRFLRPGLGFPTALLNLTCHKLAHTSPLLSGPCSLPLGCIFLCVASTQESLATPADRPPRLHLLLPLCESAVWRQSPEPALLLPRA